MNELVVHDGSIWDMIVHFSLFPYPIIKEILKIHLPTQLEHYKLILMPSLHQGIFLPVLHI